MPTECPRVFVTLRKGEYDAIKAYAGEANLSLSKAISTLALQSLENREDSLRALGKIALMALEEEREDRLLVKKAARRISNSTEEDYVKLNREEFSKAFDEAHDAKHVR